MTFREVLAITLDYSRPEWELMTTEQIADLIIEALPDEWNPDKLLAKLRAAVDKLPPDVITELIEQRDKEGSEQ